ncbi:pyridoxamine 5'-phosphate oxidase family protein [Paraburkholderia rhynchosiae]|uniref:Pyridoxamine 5'-phosphate oxidase n=1 Tax=Paraburkholderia rhynchosiae TaxID=487049 RepID=A0A2N7W717_9BURK|nr:pyridoxamine 5'-phosphate oxidase family protein [Paraburkholderia rhynchosiae]PMS25195.1 pyridoxamine 5'-phosphate oxidase [Paraburkholderia rhynchosiae]CAB3719563.1 hypothetical protein LMG27174_04841 [Paraburkholderia rhynchosiae]
MTRLVPHRHVHPSDIAFTPTVKALQSRNGSRDAYARMEEDHGWQTRLTPDVASFIEQQTSVFFATVSGEGQPYIQHRGGPPGFLRVLDDHSIAFADFAGNRQYITAGNLVDNPKAHLFLVDYAHRRRIKIWGEARVIDDDPALLAKLMPEDYKARGERVIVMTARAWDVNCPKHIPQRFEAADVAAALKERDERIAELEAQVAELKRLGAASAA